ncbi:MAG: N5-glutamine methyltransferase family protein, partial [Wujia sp.]
IGISFACKRKEAGFDGDKVELADISDAATTLSTENNRRLQAGCTIIKTDLFTCLDGKYDIIISNPPYIPTDVIPGLMQEVRDFEPHLALDGKKDGLYFYDKIIKEAREYLHEDGVLLFEIGYDQLEDVRGLLVENRYTSIEGFKDYAGHDRVVVGIKSGV